MNDKRGTGFTGSIKAAAQRALEAHRKDPSAAEAAWAAIRAEAAERGLGLVSENGPGGERGPTTPWGPTTRSWAVVRGVTAFVGATGRGVRVTASAARALLSEDLRDAASMKGSGYFWFQGTRLGLLWDEHPEWAALAGMTLLEARDAISASTSDVAGRSFARLDD